VQLLSTTKIDLEQTFNSDQPVPVKLYVKTKGKQSFKIKDVPLSSLKDTYLLPCQMVIDQIIRIQSRLHDRNMMVNLTKEKLNDLIGCNRKRLTALFILEHTTGIIEVNHRYKFKTGSNYSKSYTIAPQYQGDIISIEGAPSYSLQQNKINKVKGAPSYSHHSNDKQHHTTTNSGAPVSSASEAYQRRLVRYLTKDKVGRLWSNINQMPKEERARLNMVDVDFSSSHLQHLIKVMSDDIITGVYVPFLSVDYFNEEANGFKERVLAGDIYTSLANEYSKNTGIPYNRQQVKKNVMWWLTGSYSTRKFIKWLRNRYSQITHYIDYMNSNYSTGIKTCFKKRLPKRNGMVIKLMKSESYLINELIVDALAKDHPDSICYTVFDGILIEPKHVDTLTSIINQKGLEYFKFRPIIKTTGKLEVVKESVYDLLPY
jgi:hypothetical protein